MPQSIISQFQRAYNSPIETRRQVNTSTDRDNIPSSVRWRGMLVHVIADDTTYELVGGIDNGSWQPLGGLQDAPSDGEYYVRRNSSWEILPSVNQTSGSFSCGLVDSGGGATYTINNQECKWIKTGNIRHISILIDDVDKVGTASGNLQITGMPGTPDGFQVCAAEVSGSGVDHTVAFIVSASGGTYNFIRKTGVSITQYQTFPAPDTLSNFRLRVNFSVIEV